MFFEPASDLVPGDRDPATAVRLHDLDLPLVDADGAVLQRLFRRQVHFKISFFAERRSTVESTCTPHPHPP
jgi:hypothetical protein